MCVDSVTRILLQRHIFYDLNSQRVCLYRTAKAQQNNASNNLKCFLTKTFLILYKTYFNIFCTKQKLKNRLEYNEPCDAVLKTIL